jgi:hypothetical protein
MYNYEENKKDIFTEDGLMMFLAIRDNVQKLLKEAGAVRMENAISCSNGNGWTKIACVDHLIKLGELREIVQDQKIRAQDRVFVSGK